MRFKIRKPFLFIFEPWLHWQEFRQQTSDKAGFWVRYLHIGRVTILWDAPKNGTPTRIAHIRSTEETKLRIPNEQKNKPEPPCFCYPNAPSGRPLHCEAHDQPAGTGE